MGQCARHAGLRRRANNPWFTPAREGIIDRLARLGDAIPADAELGYHFCYGSYGGRHFVEPKDMRAMVDLANGITGTMKRRLDFLHMPVPIERDDDAYFAPLRDLRRTPGMDVYLGLIHDRDGAAGTLKRFAAAQKHLSDFRPVYRVRLRALSTRGGARHSRRARAGDAGARRKGMSEGAQPAQFPCAGSSGLLVWRRKKENGRGDGAVQDRTNRRTMARGPA